MGKNNFSKKVAFVLILMISFIFSGCPDSNQEQSQNQPQSKKEEKKPDKLKKIEESIEAMIGMLGGIPTAAEEEKQQNQQQGQQGAQQGGQQGSDQAQGGQQAQGEQKKQGAQQQGGQQGGQQAGQQEKPLMETKPQVNWMEAFKNIEDIHKQWNDYIAQAAKDGVSKSNIDGFGNTLDDLTGYIGLKYREPAILSANSLTLYIANFWSSYDGKVPPDIKRLKHYIRNIIYYSYIPDWSKTEKSINISKSLFQSIRTSSDKEKQDLINKVDYSIQELERVLKRKNPSLIKIKGKLVVDNIMELEKQMESSK